MCNPIFVFTTGRAWNHDLPTLLALLAFFAAVHGVRRQQSGWLFISGVLGGLAVGTRLTFAPPALAMAAAPWLANAARSRRRTVLTASYLAGLVVALTPLLLTAWRDPSQFVFGNFTYPMLNTAFRDATGYTKSMSPLGKARFVFKDVLIQPGNLAGLALLGMTIVLAKRRWRRAGNAFQLETQLLVVVSLSTIVAGLAPTPLFLPYFFTPAVFLLLLGVHCAAAAWSDPATRPLLSNAVIACAVICGGLAVSPYRGVLAVWDTRTWVPLQWHRAGATLPSRDPRPHRHADGRAGRTTGHLRATRHRPVRTADRRVRGRAGQAPDARAGRRRACTGVLGVPGCGGVDGARPARRRGADAGVGAGAL